MDLLAALVALWKWAEIQVLVLWGTVLIILTLSTCWMRATPNVPPTMGQFLATRSISLLRIQQIVKVLFSKWWMACLTKRRWPVLVSLAGSVRKYRGRAYTKQALFPVEWKIYLRRPNLGFPLNLQGWQTPPNLEMPSTWNVARLCSKMVGYKPKVLPLFKLVGVTCVNM